MSENGEIQQLNQHKSIYSSVKYYDQHVNGGPNPKSKICSITSINKSSFSKLSKFLLNKHCLVEN